jgi:outer membrane receptor protein involved in Fe transport
MRLKTLVLCSSSAMILALGATPAFAQDEPAPADTGLEAQEAPGDPEAAADDATSEDIVVTGIRRSLQSAQNIRRNSEQIVDSVVAEDIGKLPDLNTAQTAARIPGVQVYRQGGEAQNVLVRGLPNFTTT